MSLICSQNRKALIFAFMVFILSHIGFENIIHNSQYRPTVWETDDNYHYILKTPLKSECSKGECPGLTEIINQTQIQLSQETPQYIKRSQESISHRSLLIYHPLYSWLLGIIHDMGFSWEKSQYLLNIAGHILVGLGIATMVLTWFGTWPAILTLLMMTTLWSLGGMTIMKPSTLSAGATLIAWAFIPQVTRWKLMATWLSLLLATGLHGIGGVAAILTIPVVLAEAYATKKLRKNKIELTVFALGCIILFLYAFKGMGTLSPHNMSMLAYHAPSLQAIVASNAKMLHTLLSTLSTQIPLTFLIFGILAAPFLFNPSIRWRAITMSLLCIILMILSIFYPSPDASVLERLWPILSVFIIAQASAAFVILLQKQNFKLQSLRELNLNTTTNNIMIILFQVSTVLALLWGLSIGIGTHLTAINYIKTNKNVSFDPKVITSIVNETPLNESLGIYIQNLTNPHGYELQEGLVYFSLVYGATQRAIQIFPISSKYNLVTSMLILNPIVQMTGNDLIPAINAAELIASQQTHALRVKNNGNTDAKININNISLTIDANSEKWYPINSENQTIKLTATSRLIRVTGWKTDKDQITSWPWDKNATIKINNNNIKFNWKDILPQPCTFQKIIDDTTSIISIKTMCKE
jgi:hypothetical protein